MEIAAWEIIRVVCYFYYINIVSNRSKTQNEKLMAINLQKLTQISKFVFLWL